MVKVSGKKGNSMNVLLASTANLQDKSNTGVIKKVQGQVNGLKKLGINVDSVLLKNTDCALVDKDNITEELFLPTGTIRRKICFILDHFLNATKHYDVLYLRLPGMSLQLIRILKEYRRRGTKVVIEVYTYPLINERLNSAKRRFKDNVFTSTKDTLSTVIDGCLYCFLRTCTDKIVTYTLDKNIWGIPTISISNGIDFDNEKILPKKESIDKAIHLITVANISYWHGYDRLIKGISNYYKKGNNEYEVYFHIVGNGPEKTNLEMLVRNLHLEDHVIFYGIKVNEELNSIYKGKDIGVASLAMHRKNCLYTSELKIREYFAKGLPFIIGTKDPSLEFEQVSRFCCTFPPDDNPINIDDVVRFWKAIMYDTSLQHDMREYGLNHYDWKIQMKRVIDEIGIQ